MSVNEKFSDEFYDSVVKNAEEENQVICRVVFSAFFRHICQETCRNFELDEDFD